MEKTKFFRELFEISDFTDMYMSGRECREFQGDVMAPDNYGLSVAENIVHSHDGVDYRISFIDDNGSINHDGGPLRFTFSVFDMMQNKHLFYFSVTGTYSSWGSAYFYDPEDWQVVDPITFTTHSWCHKCDTPN